MNDDKPTEGALLEQRHQLLDLDVDSLCRDYPDATCVACLPETER